MPSVRVKKGQGYQSIDDAPPVGRPRSQSFASFLHPVPAQTPQEPGAGLSRSRTHTSDGSITNGGRQPSRRPHALSKVSQHISSTTRHIPQLPPARPPQTSETSHLSDIQERSSSQGTRGRRAGSYTLEGQQAELRVPIDGNQDQTGSSISLALEQLDQERVSDIHHSDDIVEHLDVIDPQISTVSTLTNAANAIVVPPLSFYSRKPVVVLPRLKKKKKTKQTDPEKGAAEHDEEPEYEDALDQHVEDCLRKRDKFRRVMQGVWSFIKTPLGIVTAIYGFCVVFWGTGIVFFLAKFINLHNSITQGFWVELCQQVETGLFTATSIGFIPFRVMDTYRVCKIWHYKRKVARLRVKAGLPELYDPDDLPDPVYDPNYIHVLTEKEQIDLHYQQHHFMASQTWYRPHGTQTHRAFPINLALWICVCNDLNSFFQILLSGTMWGLDRFQRPAWTTGTTLPAAFIAGIIAGVLIYWGGRKTRRTELVIERLRMALKMEHDSQQHLSPSHGGTHAINVDEAGQRAGRVPVAAPAATVESSTDTATNQDSDTNVEPKAIEVEGDARSVEKHKGLSVKIQAHTDRQPSSRSLRFADEMVVPSAEQLSSAQTQS